MYIKTGMGGSRCGRGRREGTEVLKDESKSARRQLDRQEVEEQLTPGFLAPSVYVPETDFDIDAEYRSETDLWSMAELDDDCLDLGEYLPDDYWEDFFNDNAIVEDYDVKNDPFNCE